MSRFSAVCNCLLFFFFVRQYNWNRDYWITLCQWPRLFLTHDSDCPKPFPQCPVNGIEKYSDRENCTENWKSWDSLISKQRILIICIQDKSIINIRINTSKYWDKMQKQWFENLHQSCIKIKSHTKVLKTLSSAPPLLVQMQNGLRSTFPPLKQEKMQVPPKTNF